MKLKIHRPHSCLGWLGWLFGILLVLCVLGKLRYPLSRRTIRHSSQVVGLSQLAAHLTR